MNKGWILAAIASVALGCTPPRTPPPESAMQLKLAKYTTFRLAADVSALTDDQREMIRLFIEAAELMDEAFWIQAYGDREALLESIDDPDARRFAVVNYGPWDRLDGDAPFLEGRGPKPKGANFYPADVTREELEEATGGDDDAEGQERRGGREGRMHVERHVEYEKVGREQDEP
jgi:hypothetical protein